jgi:antitoxin MazE
MKTVVRKWGDSLGIRIPSLLVKEFNLRNGSSVDVREDGGRLVIVPGKLNLADMLEQIVPGEIPTFVETETPVGEEEW